jgi:pimeloyl-ACP methyl ester carboxylesterase
VQHFRSELVADLLHRLPGSIHMVAAQSGHFVQFDQPELVVDAVRTVVEAIRQSQRRPRLG